MKTLKVEIYDQNNKIDVTHKINTIELDNWINHLKFFKKELKNLIAMCDVKLNRKLDDDVLKCLKKKEVENDNLLRILIKYMNSRRNIIECSSCDCDMVFITEHVSYRRSYLYLST